MHDATPLLPQHAFMAWCSIKAEGQVYLYLLQSVKMEVSPSTLYLLLQ
jgi:hypothetical protein